MNSGGEYTENRGEERESRNLIEEVIVRESQKSNSGQKKNLLCYCERQESRAREVINYHPIVNKPKPSPGSLVHNCLRKVCVVSSSL